MKNNNYSTEYAMKTGQLTGGGRTFLADASECTVLARAAHMTQAGLQSYFVKCITR